MGGGLGWLGYKYGLASDNLLSVDIVTADGQCRVASATEHPDLFWAVSGGGGNFGVVTSFEYRLHPVGPVLAGPVFHPFAKAKEVLQFYRDFASATHEQLTTYAVPMTTPDGAKVIALAVCYSGPLDEGERLIAPVRQFGPPLEDQIRPMAYTEFQSMFDAGFPPGTSTTRKPTSCGRSVTMPSTSWSNTLPASPPPYPCCSSSRVVAPCDGVTRPTPIATSSVT